MPRWEGDAAGRLERAALELFDERGFDRTTVAQIARRAGLTERSFYRYFADKREVLFGGGEELERRLTEELQEVPAGVGPLETLLTALEGSTDVIRPKDLLRIRGRVIGANPELRERELGKLDAIDALFVSALQDRGESETAARIATDVATSIWRVAAKRWLHGDDAVFEGVIGEAMQELRRIVAGDRVAADPLAAGR